MPTKIQSSPKNEIPSHAPDVLHDELTNAKKNLQHREALRLALGSILAPKRPYSPPSRSHSRSSSGTASPTLSFPFPSASPSPSIVSSPSQSPPSHSSPIHGHTHGWLAESHMQPLHMHPPHSHHSHPHTPSRLGITDSNSSDYLSPHSLSPTTSGSPTTSSHNSPVISPSTGTSHPLEVFPPLPDAASEHSGNADAVPPIQSGPDATGYGAHREAHDKASGSETPKAKFIETLQSKSAWDALIHGSFS